MPGAKSPVKPRKSSAGQAPVPDAPADQVDAQLARYRSMRDFGVTAEPAGATEAPDDSAAPKHPFCIQKHAATRLHYDFRLGWNGVLKSWACAKGPSYVVADKRLAVEVEDHPMEYGGFEGIIPKGQYGGGTVMVWDQGIWEPQPGHTDVDEGLRAGQLKILMHGTKMRGKWALIRMGGKFARESKPNWLLIKEHDEFEQPASAPAVTEAEPNSVVTGRSLEEIAAEEDHVWNSKETQTADVAWHRTSAPSASPAPPAPAGPLKAKKTAARKKNGSAPAPAAGSLRATLESLPKEHQPTFLKPQLAEETAKPPAGAGWLHELKLDGYRMQARKDGDAVQMLTRTGLDWTERVKAVAAAVARLPFQTLTLDGEVVVLAPDGTTNFADLQASFQQGARHPLTFFCFDLLHIDGRNPRELPLLERKRLLGEVLAGEPAETVQLSEHLTTDGEAMFHKACELRAEGIVSKKADRGYYGGRNGDWLKSKCLHVQEFVVGGYTLPGGGNAGGPGIGALLLGTYDDGAAKLLRYAGRAGTGFTQKTSRQLRGQLEALGAPSSPFMSLTAEARRGAQFVRPELVAQIRFATWTADDQLRQAAFLGLREDKPAREVRRERGAPTPKGAAAATPPQSADNAKPLARPPIRLTHPDRVLDPASKLTKQGLADFYWAVAERMLPHVAGRPLSIVRLPNGIGKPAFYQKHVTSTLPPGFDSVDVPDKKTGVVEPYVALSTPEAIASLAQMSVLELHPWGSLAADLEHADRLVIDLDPDEALPWPVLAETAAEVRKRLRALGLESFLKTTGGKGLHVVFPIAPELTWDEVKTFAHAFVTTLERASPKLYLTKMTKAARTGRIYLDYLRNERGQTAVAPYSPRARPNVGVAVPLAWSELKLTERPVFTVGNFGEWSGRLKKDPWAAMLTLDQRVTPEARRAVGMR